MKTSTKLLTALLAAMVILTTVFVILVKNFLTQI
jgi:hypothetical protein